MNNAINVGFFLHQTNWNGGLNYISNLVTAITSSTSKRVSPKIFIGKKFNGELPHLEGVYIKTALLDRWSILWIFDQILKRIRLGDGLILFLLLKKNNIDLISHASPMKSWYRVPCISWIPDFQHLHNKNFFKNEEVQTRNEGIQNLIDSADAIILSSNHALNDLKNNFSLKSSTKTYVLHFHSVLTAKLGGGASKSELIEKYKLGQDWFYIPNQYWAHKNHKLVIRALGEVLESGLDISIVSSGSTEDYRNPDYFQEILSLIDEKGVSGHFHILGSIPYCDVVELIKASVAIINPSLFEGWSTTVEEARALNKKILLSRIPVHIEQAPLGALYFDVDNHLELADCLRSVYEFYLSANKINSEAHSLDLDNAERILGFANAYEKIVLDVHAKSRSDFT
jgi:glycosyltransferase involved in cell wall biosynthesis